MSSPGEQEETTMANEARTEPRESEGAGASSVPEQTRSGPVYSPAVDIFETDQTITVLADLPGVKAEELDIDLRDDVLSLTGRVTPEGTSKESLVLREYRPGTYFRRFILSQAIDQAKIDAKLEDGVLRLELPKVQKARPRQIKVKSA
jgi:HSP20 family protein